MKNVEKKFIWGKRQVPKVDDMFKKIILNNIVTLNKVMCSGRIITLKLLSVKNSKDKQKNYSMWKKRIEN